MLQEQAKHTMPIHKESRMPPLVRHPYIPILAALFLTVVMPVCTGYLLNAYFSYTFVHIPLHSVLEVTGGVIAIVISMIFYLKFRQTSTMTHFNWSTTALLAMGIIDIFHASVMPGQLFVWLHSMAVFFGGLFFITVWIPKRRIPEKLYRLIPLFFTLFSVSLSLLSVAFSHLLPAMVHPDGTFSATANGFNLIGGIGFFVAAAKFSGNFVKNRQIDELLFVGHTMLFGIAGLLFVSSVIWDMQWWLWHVLRLSAYIIAFYFLYDEYRNEIANLGIANTKLRIAHAELSKHLATIDQNVITFTTDTNGMITNVSSALCDISGYGKQELIGHKHTFFHASQGESKQYTLLNQAFFRHLNCKEELEIRTKTSERYWLEMSVTPNFDPDDRLVSYTAICHDVTDKKQVEILSITDPLTQLFNRRHFNAVFSQEILKARMEHANLGFFIMDIDHFKEYNDTYGHQSGDAVLIAIGRVLKAASHKQGDCAFRLGGEEFGMIIAKRDIQESLRFARNILADIAALKLDHTKNSATRYVSASIGLVVGQAERLRNAELLYRKADRLLYRAKKAGRNRVMLEHLLL